MTGGPRCTKCKKYLPRKNQPPYDALCLGCHVEADAAKRRKDDLDRRVERALKGE